MTLTSTLRRVNRHLRDHGFRATAGEIASYSRRTASAYLEGMPGHYRVRYRLLCRQYDPAAITPVWVDPDRIETLSGGYERRDRGHLDYVPQFKPREAGWDYLPFEESVPYGTLKGDDWDIRHAPFDRLIMYRGVRTRFVEDVPWEETDYYQELITMFEQQGFPPADSSARASARCEKLDSLATTLREQGYQSQRALNGHPLHEVTVNISRDGSLAYNCEGRHRLCLAKVLGIERIPVLVLVRHTDAPEPSLAGDDADTQSHGHSLSLDQ